MYTPPLRSHCLATLITKDVAIDTAVTTLKRALPRTDPMHVVGASKSYFPLLGLAFQLRSNSGPARRLSGTTMHVAVDRCSGTPIITSQWPLSPDCGTPSGALDCSQLKFRVDIPTAIDSARHAVTASLMRRLKLAAAFDLEVVECWWPLWKPNWCVQFLGHDVLVDAITGNTSVRTTAQAKAS
ncbi:hypothetical protein CMUST_01935 [Corynebacterium mustelae]|uniref:Uncharacterized protein n=1 Tax=Corynebacterium mustelae TaxID=571915 RepID=A0A0G3H0Z2_9CORY|nr:hypothetical protein CMUST_01935 [Corynebacterium mustelae]